MNGLQKITISLASPEDILERSYGEVLKPETINNRSFKPEVGGLFCEKIFGPDTDLTCHCGQLSGIGNIGSTCGQCGVEITWRSVRRERMGHIELGVPIVHPWYFKHRTNILGHLLGLKLKDLKKVIYYEHRIVVQPGSARPLGVREGQLLSADEYRSLLQLIRADNDDLDENAPDKFIAMFGGKAILAMLRRLDLDLRSQELRYQVQTETSQARKDRALTRLDVVESFREARRREAHEPEWMVLRVLPVIPPDLRPLVPQGGGEFAASDLNDLYRRVVSRNNRVKRFTEIGAPESILYKEKRRLQEAVDELLDKGGTSQGRPLKSLADGIKGKEGRLRRNLLGKRVDYSGRSVIVPAPELELHQCGLPKAMAYELFRPFIIHRFEDAIIDGLIRRRVIDEDLNPRKKQREARDRVRSNTWMAAVRNASGAMNGRAAIVEDILESAPGDVEAALEEVIQDRLVLLNRAPTLHRLNIQAFDPVLTEGKAIRLHPLVCAAYNADFDGDQMAVHVPLSDEACQEAKRLMRPIYNILGPAHGEPLAIPTQDVILGLHYMTKAKDGEKGEDKRFVSSEEVRIAYDHGAVALHERIKLRNPDASAGQPTEMIETTVGRVLFNEIVPEEVAFINEVLTKEYMRAVIERILKECGDTESRHRRTARFLDDMKDLGFEYSTRAGHTFSLTDLVIPDEKEKIVAEAREKVERVTAAHEQDEITETDRYNQVIDIWTKVNKQVSEVLQQTLKEHKMDGKREAGFNTIYLMVESGARGSKEQIRQLGGMRGLMTRPQKMSSDGANRNVIENPVLSNFKEGLSVLEYFNSTHGARKGLADTAEKTADAGYLTRRLVEAAHDVAVTRHDCGVQRGINVSALESGGEIAVPLKDRIAGRTSVHELQDPRTDELLVGANELISEETAASIAESAIDEVEIRSPLTCEARRGVCARCYGQDPAMKKQMTVETGEPVGVVAAQSIGEPGTQMTLRTFHTGGTAEEGGDITTGLPRVNDLFEARTSDGTATVSEIEGAVSLGNRERGFQEIIVTSPDGDTEKHYIIDLSEPVHVREGDHVRAGNRLSDSPTALHGILAIKGRRAVQKHIVREIQKVYRSQGVVVNDKHIEIIVRRMTERMVITDPGDTELLEEQQISRFRLAELNDDLEGKRVVIDPGDADVAAGAVVSQDGVDILNTEMKRRGLRQIAAREARPAVGRPALLGITQATLSTASWVAAASFQETTKVLTDAAIRAQEDPLRGMKEKVITARLSEHSSSVRKQVPFRNVTVLVLGQVPFKEVSAVKCTLLLRGNLEPDRDKRDGRD